MEMLSPHFQFKGVLGSSPLIQTVIQTVRDVAPSNAPILIFGESGTGKELVARAIHENSPRQPNPFMVINCSAIPEGLLESELFGHVKGAFTDALQEKMGLFERADGGTIFLDEIGEVPLSLQVKLLRVLQEKEVRKIGSSSIRSLNVRFLAATHRNLVDMITQGKFREDLYYRLNVISIHLPPLRDRTEDIPLFVEHFLKKCSERTHKQIEDISFEALQVLQNYPWPGNIRELENLIERCVVLSDGLTLEARHLPKKILDHATQHPLSPQENLSKFSYKEAKAKALKLFHQLYFFQLLKDTQGNITVASHKAGLDRSNFKKLLKKCHFDLKILGNK